MKKRSVFKEFNDAKWEQVRTHPYYAAVRADAVAQAEKLLSEPLPQVKFSSYMRFFTEGTRKPHGSEMGAYTNRMSMYFLAYLITGDEKYIAPLVDVMWSICDLESWSQPAHLKEESDFAKRRRFLELGSTRIGHFMSEILYFIGDKLPKLAYDRCLAELKYRIVDSYLHYDKTDDFWWYTATNNWSTVCIAGVFGTMMYIADDEQIERAIPRAMATAQCFIDGLSDDGCCLEGASYWNYGFSHYLMFASQLYEYTEGRINLFENEKVKRIAGFYSHVALNETQCISFSDGGMRYAPSAWIMHKIHSIYPDISVPPIPAPEKANADLRTILWTDPDIDTQKHELSSYRFPDAQWFLYVGDSSAVAAKGGYNKEPHNHNDIGSFIVSKNGAVTFCDPGCGEYVKTYFGAGRYTHLVTSARGHSVPIINGQLQCTAPTKDDRAKVYNMTEDRFTVDFSNGYPSELRRSMTAAVRDFVCEPDAMTLTDSFTFVGKPESLVEQFVALTPIVGEEGGCTCGDTRLTYDAELYDVSFGSEDFRRNNGTVETLYWIRLAVKSPSEDMKLTFRFE